MTGPLLDVRDLVKYFPMSRNQSVKAVNKVSFEVYHSEALALVGESGSGKTTVGRCVLRLIEPTDGTIFFRDQDITAISQGQFRSIRPKIQMVFQDPYDSLDPRIRIGETVDEPMMLAKQISSHEQQQRVAELLEMVGLGSYGDKYPHQLSGGEQQRVCIARAIATKPDIIVLDEPTSALDVSVRAEILDLLGDLQHQLGLSYIFISHDLTAVRRVCHRVAIMYLGKIVEMGKTEEIFEHPLHPYSRALLSSVLYPDPTRERSRFLLKGEIPSPINLPPGCSLYARCPWAIEHCNQAYPPYEEVTSGHYVSCFRVKEKIDTPIAAGASTK
ncbi:ABC transporter ATP-binding protein [bacterium]|nr:MAG: ABC transporter ATP-binding protein [bacterium]